MFDGSECISGKNHFTGVEKFLSRHPTFRVRNFTCMLNQTRQKIGGQNQSVRPIEAQLETFDFVLC